MSSGRAEDDDVLVLPPLPADPLFVDAVDEAVAGSVDDLPDAQPERTLGGNTRDFASLYIRHRASFGLHARRFLHDPRDVEEVLQEAFLRLFLAMPELETELQALAYCRRTVTNLCIDRYRADQRRPRLLDLDAIDWDPSDEKSYDDPVLRAEDAAIVRQALALLSPMHRAALVKREIEEKPLPQIAEELGVPEESVKHLLYRARRALRRLLAGTSVEPGADLSNTELLRLANERLARATLRSANVLIVLFVAAVTVVGALRVGANDQARRGIDVGAVGTPQQTGADAPSNGAHRATTPRRHTPAKPARTVHKPHHVTAPAAPVAAPAAPSHKESFASRTPAKRSAAHPVSNLPAGPAHGTFSIDAPVLGAVGAAALHTIAVDGQPATGAVTNSTTFSADTTDGRFALQQVVQRSGEGVVSANLTPRLTTATTTAASAQPQTYSSTVTTSPTQDGNVLVDVHLLVASQVQTTTTPVDNSAALDIRVQAVYTPDVIQVLAETVKVVEGSAPCCDPTATPNPPNTSGGSGTSSLPSAPTAVSSASVSPMSPTRRDDQAPATSSQQEEVPAT